MIGTVFCFRIEIVSFLCIFHSVFVRLKIKRMKKRKKEKRWKKQHANNQTNQSIDYCILIWAGNRVSYHHIMCHRLHINTAISWQIKQYIEFSFVFFTRFFRWLEQYRYYVCSIYCMIRQFMLELELDCTALHLFIYVWDAHCRNR